MNTNNNFNHRSPVLFRRFGRKGYSLFSVLGREVLISVLSVATLTHASAESASVRVLPGHVFAEAEDELLADDTVTVASEQLSELEVVGSRIPMSQDRAVRLVQVLTRRDIEAASAHSVNDLLKLVAGVDVRQRGAYGIQTDVGVNGGTQDQVTVLLNGVNITSAHTGHLTMDLPVSVEDIERIEVLEGGASRVYGSAAFSGTINIVTRQSQQSDLRLHLEAGSFGTVGGGASLGVISKATRLRQNVSANYMRSDGGTDNSDFNRSMGYYQGSFSSPLVDVRWQGGLSRQDYGANTFYSAKFANQYEENTHLLASVRADYKGPVHITPQVYWNRSTDHYVLNRVNPAAYENFHKADNYGASVNAYVSWLICKTSVGAEVRRENIQSSSLGKPLGEDAWIQVPGRNAYYKNEDGRTNVSIYAEQDILLPRLTLSIGVLANKNSALNYPMHLYPGVDMCWRPTDNVKLYASFNQSLRMPTYTDLYYTGPNLEGNPLLRPEKSTDFSVGADMTFGALSGKLKAFYRRGTDMIDWVKYSAEDSNHSTNFDLDYLGAEAVLSLDGERQWGSEALLKRMTLSYCFIDQKQDNVPEGVYSSSYALDYLRHKFVASLTHRIFARLEAQWDFSLRQRNGEFDLYDLATKTTSQHAYGTHAALDLRLQWSAPTYTLFVMGNNLTNHRYYDISNVLQPGLWVMAGAKLNLKL